MLNKIDKYYLGQPLKDAEGLTEFTSEEYKAFEMVGYVKILDDDKIFHGFDSQFLTISWNTQLGGISGKIYKIAIQYSTEDKTVSNKIFKDILQHLVNEMGKWNEHPLLSKKYIWDKSEGNVILMQQNMFNIYSIDLFLTLGELVRNSYFNKKDQKAERPTKGETQPQRKSQDLLNEEYETKTTLQALQKVKEERSKSQDELNEEYRENNITKALKHAKSEIDKNGKQIAVENTN